MNPITSPTLLVLAAGMGSRYGGLKQIDPVGPGGETLMDYSVYDALRAGFTKLVFVIRKDIEQPFKELLGARFQKHIPVEYVFQELNKIPPGFSVPAGRTKPWGTTQAILMADNAIDSPFAVINADDFYGAESFLLLAHHLQSGAANYAMVAFVLRNTLSEFGSVARGVCTVGGGDYLQSVVELTGIERKNGGISNTDATGRTSPLTGDEPVSLNMWGFTPAVFGQLRNSFHRFLARNGSDLKAECYIPATVNELITTGETRVKVLHTPDTWFGITYREDRARVIENIGQLIQRGCYPERLWS
jgi:UTP-glucose-1-phosphate uridylyltransferase